MLSRFGVLPATESHYDLPFATYAGIAMGFDRGTFTAERERRIKLGRAFEEEVAHAYRERGYLVTITGSQQGDGRRGDGGIDLFIRREDDPHAPTVAVQCKAWNRHPVERKDVDEFANVVRRQAGVDQGILITTSWFTRKASEIAADSALTLIDGRRLLAELGIDPEAFHERFPKIASVPAAPYTETAPSSPPPRASVSSAPHVSVVSKPVARRSHGLALAACLLALAGGIGYVVARLTSSKSTAPVVQAPEPAAAPIGTKPVATKPVAESPRVVAKKRTERHKPHTPPAVTRPEPAEPVIYKSADMSDAEFAAWKRRKAEREQEAADGGDRSPPPDPAYVDGPRAEGVSSRTMQVILRSNGR
ncbi:restriction endonuclease [Luteibacter sp. PPL552]